MKRKLIDFAGKLIICYEAKTGNFDSMSNGLEIEVIPHEQLALSSDGVILFILDELKSDLKRIIDEISGLKLNPEEELESVFKKLYYLFNEKSYYLNLIFDGHSRNKSPEVDGSYLEVADMLNFYLSRLISTGKEQGVFNPTLSVSVLATRILLSFRSLISMSTRADSLRRKYEELKSYTI